MTAKKKLETFDPFKKYRAKHIEKRMRYVKIAIQATQKSPYNSMTKLAEGVAKIVTSFELEDAGVTEPTGNVRGCDSSALLRRGSPYKELIEIEWALRKGLSKEEESVSEVDELLSKIGNLAHQNELLKQRLKHKNIEALPDELNTEMEKMRQQIKALIDIVNGMFGQVSDLFTTVMEGDEDNEHQDAGLYGPNGFIVGIDKLNLLREAQNELRD